MPKSVKGENVRTTANGGTKQTIAPKPARRSTVAKTNDENEILQHTSSANESSSDEEDQETSNVDSPEHIYTSIDTNTKSPKRVQIVKQVIQA